MQERLIEKATELLNKSQVDRVLAYEQDVFTMMVPTFFTTAQSVQNLVYNKFCNTNLSRYLIDLKNQDGKTLVFLRPCDTYVFNQLLKENLVDREKTYIVGVSCQGKGIVEELEDTGKMHEGCTVCKKDTHKIYDELILEQIDKPAPKERMADIEALEEKTSLERFLFFKNELSKCIRCNACRNICPVCNCKKCVFDNSKFDTEQKANASTFEEQMFHIIRAYHVAGRCSDCYECSRVCPQNIPLHLLNRKLIKDINELFGEYHAGEDATTIGPLTHFKTDEDPEPNIVHKRGNS